MKKIFIPFIFLFFFSSQVFSADLHLKEQVEAFTLPNGMRWLIIQRPQAPVFSGVIMVRAGSVDESEGKTGLAHMFEHMAFKGSERLGTKDFRKEAPLLEKINQLERERTELYPDKTSERYTELTTELALLYKKIAQYQDAKQVWDLMEKNGVADFNAFTSKDVTTFHASLSSNRLGLWMYAMSEMVGRPVYRDFYIERNVVIEERRTSLENNPDGLLVELVLNNAFSKGPYHWSAIGSEEDIARLTDLDAKKFHKRSYGAKNMTGVLVGSLDLSETKKLISRYFSFLPSGKLSTDPALQFKNGNVSTSFKSEASNALVLAFHKLTLPHEDEFVFDMLLTLLCDGKSSRLEKRLIFDEEIASSVSCSGDFPGSRMENLFLIWAEPVGKASLARVEASILDEIEKLKKNPLSSEELLLLKKRVKSSFVFALEKNMNLALALARFEVNFHSWELLNDYPDKLFAVTAEDMSRVLKTYFVPENMVKVERVHGL
ncbi:MAG: hypothetical protein COX62_01235 [Deltaproteobacteria bacterium CG_4_10_14_0_2_um_filter_43_8]|nr:MAG: hypothetical protein COV43_09375 [Deltaproteobacteria bacterium CG11_big_fil_rev_8_21_14_0_20_42_23]PJA21868.1 MAG: hypothetical protein COX62_01235 [Deltaproteobacteria bacterium CG_4_10_14_0_2_um_filter_43_8]PJC64368.1 MAG: hypothetical protein CO021_05030 [Deltaproteobacteria bacterium CG_4_9_14_0_2_um_filter_42_21]